MGEIKPGILALVIGYVRNPINVGKTVRVVEFASPGHLSKDGMVFGDEGAWYCEGESLHTLRGNGSTVLSGYAYHLGKHLLPINPSADPIEQTQEQEQTA